MPDTKFNGRDLDGVLDNIMQEELQEIREIVRDEAVKAAQALVEDSKPKASQLGTGKFGRAINWQETEGQLRRNNGARWYVEKPYYRLTHLLIHKHQLTRAGKAIGEAPKQPRDFLDTADKRGEEFVENVKKAIEGRNG